MSTKTIQDIEQGRNGGTVQTLNRILGVLGLKLGVVRMHQGYAGQDVSSIS